MIQFIDVLSSNLWLEFLLNATIKSFVIFAVAGILVFLLRRKSAALRSLVWCMAIFGCLMVPVFSLTLSPLEIGVLPGKPVGFGADVPHENNQPVAAEVSSAPPSSPTAAAPSTDVTPPSVQSVATTDESGTSESNGWKTGFVSLHWTNWIALIWAVVALFLFVRLVVGIGGVWRITARSDDFSGSIRDLQLGSRVGGWRRPVRIRRSDEVTAPIMWGLFRPTILLPADAGDWGGERLRAVLLHELAHIQRNDWESQLIAQMMCVVYWFNPLVWFAARRMRVEAERACDDYVLSTGYQSTDYAQHLVDIARNVKRADSVSRAAVAITRSSRIEERIRMILAENLNRRPLTKVALVVGYCIVIFFAMQIGAMRLVEAGNQENGLYQEIQSVSNSHPEPLAKDATEADKEAWQEERQRSMEGVIALCDKFLRAFPESDRYDEIWYEKLIYFRLLRRDDEFDAGVEKFFSERPTSKYADKLHSLQARRTEVEKYEAEVNRKREMYAEEAYHAFKSFVAVEADGELFTGVILTRVGHILVPATVADAKLLRAKIVDYQPAEVVAVDAESGLAIITVEGHEYLRPIVLGTVDNLQEFALVSVPNSEGHLIYPNLPIITVRGYPDRTNLPPEIREEARGHPIGRQVSVMQLDIDGNGKVATLNVSTDGRQDVFIRGDAAVYYDGRLLAVSAVDKMKYGNWSMSFDAIPIDQIRAALERMGMTQIMNRDFKKPGERFEMVLEAENFTRLKMEKPKVQKLLIAKTQPFLITKDSVTSGGAYIVANPALEDQDQVGETWLAYEIEIPEDGDYAIWLYARGYTGKSDSFFLGTDLEAPRACDVTSRRQWGTVPAVDRNSVQGVPAFRFTKGVHEIRLAVRETGTELDAILITNDLSLGSPEVDQRFLSRNSN